MSASGMPTNKKLRAAIEADELVIRIGIGTLAFAVGEGNGVEPGVKVTDEMAFALWVADNVTEFDPDETGTGALGRIFDCMAVDAVEGAQDFVAELEAPK